MADTDNSPRPAIRLHAPLQASVSASTGLQQTAQGRSSAATQYWQSVAAAGWAARPAENKEERQTTGQRPSARTKS